MSIGCQNLMMSGGKCCLRLLMVVMLSVLLHMVDVVRHHLGRRVGVVRALVHGLRLNLNWLLLRLNNCQGGRAVAVWVVVAVDVVKVMQVRIVHRVQVAHFDVLVEVADVRQFLLADVALINDIVGSRGRWQNRNRSGLSILSVLLLMRQDVLLQIRLLRVGLQADVASVRTNSLRRAGEKVRKSFSEDGGKAEGVIRGEVED